MNHVKFHIKRLPLTPGRYSITIYTTISDVVVDWIQHAAFFDVEAGDFYGNGKLPPGNQGDFVMDYSFQFGKESR
jgi:lipopolysaccharide transport system ATP-binding protein